MSQAPEHPAPDSRLRWLVVALGVAAWAVVAWVAITATQLRPAADDYCHAAAGVTGYFESIGMWYLTWIGDVTQVSVTALLVGQSLANLPLEASSLLPFFLTALTVSILTVVILYRAASAKRSAKVIGAFAIVPAVLVTWWAYWWMPVALDPDRSGHPWLLATAITDWQVVNVQYVLVPAALVLAWILVSTRDRWPHWAHFTVIALLGVACGTGGLVFGLSAFVFSLIFVGVRAWLKKAFNRRESLQAAVFALATLVGLIAAYLAPGAQLRSELLQPDRPLQSTSIASLYAWVFPQGVFDWFAVIVSINTLLVVGVAISFAFALYWAGVTVRTTTLMQHAGWLIAFTLVLALVSRAGDGFSYPAFWHEVMPRTFVFVAFALVGVAAGTWVLTRSNATLSVVTLVAAGLAVAVSIGSLPVMGGHISQRLDAWEVGAAPAGGAADLEYAWIEECWDRWSDQRQLPDRGTVSEDSNR